MDYQRSFQELNMEISRVNDYKEWAAIYQKLCFWELELDALESNDLQEILDHQKAEANHQFSKFIRPIMKIWSKGIVPWSCLIK